MSTSTAKASENGIKVSGLSFSYGKHEVLRDVSFEAKRGTFTAVLGANGIGKTTLFKLMLGFERKYRGSILISGREASRINARELARLIAYIPQTHAQAFNYTVLDMALMGTSNSISPLATPGRLEREKAMAALEHVGIAELSDKCYSRLSGGEQQLVIIARALAQDARMLLMDEPTSNLDYGNQTRVLERVRGLANEGYTVLLSTHNPQHALWYADNALALALGEVAAFGSAREVVTRELVSRLYGVEAEFLEHGGYRVIMPKMAGHDDEGRSL